MQVLADTPTFDRKAIHTVDEQSRALLLQLDRMEPLAEPLAKFAIALDRLALLEVEMAAKSMMILEAAIKDLRSVSIPPVAVSKKKKKALVDSNGKVISASVVLQKNLRDLHDRLYVIKTGSVNLDVRNLCGVVLNACAQMFEAADQIRWERLEDQADADLTAGRVKKFANVADLLKHLSSLSS